MYMHILQIWFLHDFPKTIQVLLIILKFCPCSWINSSIILWIPDVLFSPLSILLIAIFYFKSSVWFVFSVSKSLLNLIFRSSIDFHIFLTCFLGILSGVCLCPYWFIWTYSLSFLSSCFLEVCLSHYH